MCKKAEQWESVHLVRLRNISMVGYTVTLYYLANCVTASPRQLVSFPGDLAKQMIAGTKHTWLQGTYIEATPDL